MTSNSKDAQLADASGTSDSGIAYSFAPTVNTGTTSRNPQLLLFTPLGLFGHLVLFLLGLYAVKRVVSGKDLGKKGGQSEDTIMAQNSESSTAPDTGDTSCANCGKAETEDNKLKRCMACKIVKYCNRDCQVAHRPRHKKVCKKRAAVIISDDELFKDAPERPECPICMLPLPFNDEHLVFQACCGKLICMGCNYAQDKEDHISGKRREDCGACAFCRAPAPKTEKELIDRLNRCVERKDTNAMDHLAKHYLDGNIGLQKNFAKAIELFLEAGKLGCADAYYNVGNLYCAGNGVKMDMKRARYYWELGAIGGSISARHNLAIIEDNAGNHEQAYKHYLICAKSGFQLSLDEVKTGFKNGHVTKDEYAEALRAFQKQHEDTRSVKRDEALADEAYMSQYESF